jgi:hypothetical protein
MGLKKENNKNPLPQSPSLEGVKKEIKLTPIATPSGLCHSMHLQLTENMLGGLNKLAHWVRWFNPVNYLNANPLTTDKRHLLILHLAKHSLQNNSQ